MSVVLGGLVIFISLFFADKTNLSNKKNAALNTTPTNSAATPTSQPNNLPPLSPEASTDKWLEKLKDAKGKARVEVLDSVIACLKKRNRFDFAAQYAETRLKEDSSLTGKQVAGSLFYEATHLEHIAKDSLLFGNFSQKAVSYLEQVKEADSSNEKVMMMLGNAYVESRVPLNMMKGVRTIKKVSEQNPNNVEAAFQMGLFLMQRGKWDEAVVRFEKVISLDANNSLAKFQLARAFVELGKKEEAKNLLKSVAEKASEAELKAEANRLLNSM
ncbi:MAG: tetratricopeptide repeat protein [Bacteroidia bacterium]